MLFKGRHPAPDSEKPLLNFGDRISTYNAPAEWGLTEAFDALFEFFVVAVDLFVKRVNPVI
jgi:hypothetical protein